MAASDSHPGSAHHMIPHHHHHHHHHIRRHRVPSGGDEFEDEELDPRIQIELEKLNRSSEEINRLELELDDARAAFRQVLSDSTQRLNGLAKKLGACVDKARPYYDARMRLKEAHLDSHKAALRFERACSMHEAAKEMVQLAEEGYKRRELDLDPTWQEMLNHATMKVNDAERERMESEEFHQRTTINFKHREEDVQKLQKDLKRSITKSKPYFEMKAKFNQVMEDHKRVVSRLEEDVGSSKALYSQALRSLEAISDDIHRQRLERRQKLQLGVRGAGVGAEAPSPPPMWEKGVNIDGSASCSVFDSDVDDDHMSTSRVSHGSSETVLDGRQLKQNRSKGIVCSEPAYRKKESLTESLIMDGSFKADPLDVVVFKTANYSPEQAFQHDRSFGQVTITQSSMEDVREIQGWPRTNIIEGSEEEFGDNVVTPTPDNVLELSSDLRAGHSIDVAHRRRELSLSGSPKTDSCLSEASRKRDIELSQSSLSRAQEWVNKSPIPQQRRFVKSKSLVDATSSSLSFASPTDTDLSSSLTTDIMKDEVIRDGRDHWPSRATQGVAASSSSTKPYRLSASPSDDATEARKYYDTAARAKNEQSHHTSSATLLSSLQYVRASDRETTPEQSSPIPGSPSSSRKSPKLQGLILRVEASGISSSSAPTSVQQSRSTTTSSTNQQSGQNPIVVISTQHPKLGAFSEKAAQLQPPVSTTHPSSLSPMSLSPSAKPPTSLIAQHLNKMMSGSKVSQYNSKTAPSTLSTSYHLPTSSPLKSPHSYPPTSPTRIPLSPIPPSTAASLRHQLSSPTPSSPSADRYSLSGRSDSVTSGSQRSAFLKPPSDSSDTESIASTGPMLDDDQVELINMDFTEQSIATENQEDNDFAMVPADPIPISRGHWSRMSLPPRLSYLEGFLERTRLYTGDRRVQTLEGSDDKHSNGNTNDQNGSGSARSSVAMSGGCDDNTDDFKDEDCTLEIGKQNDSHAKCNSPSLNENPRDRTLEDEQEHNPNIDVSVEIYLENADSASREDTSAEFVIVDVTAGLAECGSDVAESLENLTLLPESVSPLVDDAAELDTVICPQQDGKIV